MTTDYEGHEKGYNFYIIQEGVKKYLGRFDVVGFDYDETEHISNVAEEYNLQTSQITRETTHPPQDMSANVEKIMPVIPKPQMTKMDIARQAIDGATNLDELKSVIKEHLT